MGQFTGGEVLDETVFEDGSVCRLIRPPGREAPADSESVPADSESAPDADPMGDAGRTSLSLAIDARGQPPRTDEDEGDECGGHARGGGSSTFAPITLDPDGRIVPMGVAEVRGRKVALGRALDAIERDVAAKTGPETEAARVAAWWARYDPLNAGREDDAASDEFSPDEFQPLSEEDTKGVAWLAEFANVHETMSGWAPAGEMHLWVARAVRALCRDVATRGGFSRLHNSPLGDRYFRSIGVGDPEEMQDHKGGVA